MMAVYSHVPRKALDEAASALEPEAAPSTVVLEFAARGLDAPVS
jgi:hypothetical protein